MARVLSSLSLAIMQTEADAERLQALGMDAGKTFVFGNMKFDAGIMPETDSLTTAFRERFRLGASPLILAASTHEPEEVLILNSFRQVTERSETKPRLMIAPRHPERFAEVADLLKTAGLRWVRRTATPETSDGQADVILLDSIGELRSVYTLASIVFVGGSIAKTGGHNVLEPAAVGAAVIVGFHTYNFQSIVETFREAGAIVQLQPMSDSATIVELGNTITELLVNPARAREIGALAQRLVTENRGATERTLQALDSMIASAANAPPNPGSLRTGSAPIA